MARAKQPVSINGIEFDALLESEEGFEADAPEYPTEAGFNVSDNITLKPETLSMTLFVTDTPVTWRNRNGTGPGHTDSVVKRMKELYFGRQLVTVVTSDAVYSDMAITSLHISKSSEIGYARQIPVSLKKVIVTGSSTVSIPASYGKAGQTGASGGTANTTTKSTGAASGSGSGSGGSGNGSNKGSLLYAAASGVGLL